MARSTAILCLADDVDLTFCFIPQPAKSERQPTMTTRNGSTAGVSVGRVGSGCSGFVRTGFRVTGHKPEIACFQDDAKGSRFYKTWPFSIREHTFTSTRRTGWNRPALGSHFSDPLTASRHGSPWPVCRATATARPPRVPVRFASNRGTSAALELADKRAQPKT